MGSEVPKCPGLIHRDSSERIICMPIHSDVDCRIYELEPECSVGDEEIAISGGDASKERDI